MLTYFIKRFRFFYLIKKCFISIKNNSIIDTFKKVISFMKRKKMSLLKINKLSYESEYQENIDFSEYKPKVKAIAFYLPQFHRIPENDNWWGEGFTEWTNTSKAQPYFNGHYQPREPHDDFGYYNLTNPEIIKRQVLLAKQHGIFGFCFYYYWFSGKRLLEKPLDLLLEHPEIDINFCLCWANENWTRRWDGQDDEILIKQNYSIEDSYNFIMDIKKYIIDKRYIKKDEKPVILVYNPSLIPNTGEVFNLWRTYAANNGIGEIVIWICRTFGHNAISLNITDKIDGEIEFPPHGLPVFYNKYFDSKGKISSIYDYKEIVDSLILEKKKKCNHLLNIYRTSMLGWDNYARKANEWITYAGFTLNCFYSWVKFIVNDAYEKYDENNAFIFINAWNEWAEGTYLEPDKKYGYANINTFSKAICGLELNV